MPENANPKKASNQSWPGDYPEWLVEVLQADMVETGMSRKDAEEFLKFELLFGGSLMQGYVAKLKAHQKETKEARAFR